MSSVNKKPMTMPHPFQAGVGRYVVPHNGGWAVKSDGNECRLYQTQAEAISAATATVQAKGGELWIDGRRGRKESLTIGRDPFMRISAVEGITYTREATNRRAEFDSKGLSPEERRQAIINAYRSKG